MLKKMMSKLDELEEFKVKAEDKMKQELLEKENREALGIEKG